VFAAPVPFLYHAEFKQLLYYLPTAVFTAAKVRRRVRDHDQSRKPETSPEGEGFKTVWLEAILASKKSATGPAVLVQSLWRKMRSPSPIEDNQTLLARFSGTKTSAKFAEFCLLSGPERTASQI
jgi:hypothetical protein